MTQAQQTAEWRQAVAETEIDWVVIAIQKQSSTGEAFAMSVSAVSVRAAIELAQAAARALRPDLCHTWEDWKWITAPKDFFCTIN